MNKKNRLLVWGAINGFMAVLFGALAAHQLKGWLSPDRLESFKTATYFQLIHAVVLVILWKQDEITSKWLKYSGNFMLMGTLFFAGSIYCLTILKQAGLSKVGILGPITPLGGVLLLIGWLLLIAHAIRSK